MKKIISFPSLAAIALMIAAVPLVVSAHERRVYQIGANTYTFVVGFLNEPVSVDDKAGVDLSVMLGNGAPTMGPDGDMDGPPAATQPVAGLEKSLKAEVSTGSEKKVFNVAPAFGAPGHYRAIFYPSIATTYTFRIFGTINNVPVNVSFPCNSSGIAPADDTRAAKISDGVTQKLSSGAFGCPASKSDQVFPAPQLTLADLDQKITNAQASAGSRGTIALVVGIAGLLAGVGSWIRRPRG